MSLDPTKWIKYDDLTNDARQRIEAQYPYLKLDQAQFQEKTSGVFMRQLNTGKVEKLLEPPRLRQPRVTRTRTASASSSTSASSSSRSRRSS